jgi:hypothetical protein
MKIFLDTANLEGFLKDWENAREPLRDILAPARAAR